MVRVRGRRGACTVSCDRLFAKRTIGNKILVRRIGADMTLSSARSLWCVSRRQCDGFCACQLLEWRGVINDMALMKFNSPSCTKPKEFTRSRASASVMHEKRRSGAATELSSLSPTLRVLCTCAGYVQSSMHSRREARPI